MMMCRTAGAAAGVCPHSGTRPGGADQVTTVTATATVAAARAIAPADFMTLPACPVPYPGVPGRTVSPPTMRTWACSESVRRNRDGTARRRRAAANADRVIGTAVAFRPFRLRQAGQLRPLRRAEATAVENRLPLLRPLR